MEWDSRPYYKNRESNISFVQRYLVIYYYIKFIPMNIGNTKPFFVSSIIAVLVLGLFGIGSSVAISQSFGQANDTNTNNNDNNNGNDNNNDSSNVEYSTVHSSQLFHFLKPHPEANQIQIK